MTTFERAIFWLLACACYLFALDSCMERNRPRLPAMRERVIVIEVKPVIEMPLAEAPAVYFQPPAIHLPPAEVVVQQEKASYEINVGEPQVVFVGTKLPPGSTVSVPSNDEPAEVVPVVTEDGRVMHIPQDVGNQFIAFMELLKAGHDVDSIRVALRYMEEHRFKPSPELLRAAGQEPKPSEENRRKP